MALHIVHHPDYDANFAATHRFPMGKYRMLMECLRLRGLIEEPALHRPAPAPARWLKLAHDETYVDQVIACAVPPLIERDIGFPVGKRVSLRAQLATGGTMLAAQLALAHGVSCNTAGGSHHARRAQGAGFCTFNDVGVAATLMLADGLANRILVVDLDVHQGDGTADIFSAEPRVFTFSMHGDRNYPTRKIDSDLDLALPDKTGDDAYLGALRDVLPILWGRAEPDFIFYNAGVDPHAEDRLGRLSLTDDGLRKRDRTVLRFFRDRGVPVCGVIGGGYSTDVEALAARHVILFETAREFS